ncbi:C40 family peptidase [Pontibacillus marinus]|uniref:NlpC/P60 domain-containing protein n=1 Tax=Pontibacillus marinus BH030004 = DSM 16465 TaxID=1385511 RepID=A0A0A5HI21_9BACI|nr:NlpC/P60 family protein [Pontibacillus marinus]KGX83302.1 hypothetical protein N783_04655 [Pontibacillus marinus BH030004 = DSM 16465]
MNLSSRTAQMTVLHSMTYSFMISQPFAYYSESFSNMQTQEKKSLTSARTLMYGHHSTSVRTLQEKLHSLSFYFGEHDSHYGVLTEHAVKSFQLSHELLPTGRADKLTLISIDLEEKKRMIEPIEKIAHTISPGETSQDVKKLQKALSFYGYYTGNVDGIYGPLTSNAIEQYQLDHKLEIDENIEKSFIQSLSKKMKNEKPKITHKTQTIKKDPKKVEVKAVGNVASIIKEAKNYLGVPYVWGGESPRGFDCSGYIQYVYQKQDIILPRTVHEIWNVTTSVKKLSVGDFVFYETYQPGPSHMGIYLGNGQFIHAGDDGVTISKMNNTYWKQRYLGAKRITKQ